MMEKRGHSVDVKIEQPDSDSDETDYVIHEIRIKSKRGTGVAIGVYNPNSDEKPSSLLVCTNPSLGAAANVNLPGSEGREPKVDKIRWEDKESSNMVRVNNINMFKVEPGIYSVVADEGDKMKVQVYEALDVDEEESERRPQEQVRGLVAPQNRMKTRRSWQNLGFEQDINKDRGTYSAAEKFKSVFDTSLQKNITLVDHGVGPFVTGTVNATVDSITPSCVNGNNPNWFGVRDRGQSENPDKESSVYVGQTVKMVSIVPKRLVNNVYQDRASNASDDGPLVGGAADNLSEDNDGIDIGDDSCNFGKETENDDMASLSISPQVKDEPLTIEISNVRTTSGFFTKQGENGKGGQGAAGVDWFDCQRCNRRFKYWFRLQKHYCLRPGTVETLLEANTKDSIHVEPAKAGDSADKVHSDSVAAAKKPAASLKKKGIAAHKSHEKTGKDAKSLKCDHCNDIFAQKLHLDDHRRTAHCATSSFVCDQCPKSFEHDAALRTHQLMHSAGKPFECAQCSRKFTRKHSLKFHYMSVHMPQSERPFRCSSCPKRYARLVDLNVHLRIHTGEKPFECNQCSSAFTKKESLKIHCMRVHGSQSESLRPFKCRLCPKSYTRKCFLDVHLRRHTGDNPFKCKHCGVVFPRNETLKNHCLRVHTPDKLFKCGDCDRRFVKKAYLEVHQRQHTGQKPFACNQCGDAFHRNDLLKVHKSRAHGDGSTPKNLYKCEDCDKSFVNKVYLEGHQRRHTGEKPFACDLCDKAFYRNEGLKAHKIKAHGIGTPLEKLFQCKDCDKSYTNKNYLEVHRRKHTGERPFKCDLCEKAFHRKDLLHDHKFRAHGDCTASYKCHMCEKHFLRKAYLKEHERVHTGEKPFSCSHCDKAFGTKYSLQNHLFESHEIGEPNTTRVKVYQADLPYKCTECEKSFATIKKLLSHMCDSHDVEGNIEKPFVCEICGHAHANNTLLNLHSRTHSDDEEAKYFVCRLCMRSFEGKAELQSHVEHHNGDCTFRCELCGKGYAGKESLKHHRLTVHFGDLPFLCEHCGKGFSRRGNYNIHVNTHTKERQFKCENLQCGKVFNRKTDLKNHEKTHKVELFTCEYCKKDFRVSSRERHMKKHIGEKAFKCGYCDLAFRVQSALKRHERTHTGERPFSCVICTAAFPRKDRLLIHLRKVHNQNI
ncbi:zinc finger protein 585A-like [Lineus longissimus]|uniref:zinc finger protein 585A-like n=1 Tax=Lineus longissimus TaxID=88925 RepID=UPI00315DBC18